MRVCREAERREGKEGKRDGEPSHSKIDEAQRKRDLHQVAGYCGLSTQSPPVHLVPVFHTHTPGPGLRPPRLGAWGARPVASQGQDNASGLTKSASREPRHPVGLSRKPALSSQPIEFQPIYLSEGTHRPNPGASGCSQNIPLTPSPVNYGPASQVPDDLRPSFAHRRLQAMSTRVSAPRGPLLSSGCRRGWVLGDARLGPACAQMQSHLPTGAVASGPRHLDGRTGAGGWGWGSLSGIEGCPGPLVTWLGRGHSVC